MPDKPQFDPHKWNPEACHLRHEQIQNKFETLEQGVADKVGATKELVDRLTTAIKESTDEAVTEIKNAINSHGKKLDIHRDRMDALKDVIPSDAISRMVELEDWKKTMPAIKDIKKNMTSDTTFRKDILRWLAVIIPTCVVIWTVLRPIVDAAISYILKGGG